MTHHPSPITHHVSLITRCSLLITLVLAILLPASVALANGGTVQVASRPAGPYAITVFTSPNPIRVGTVDVSVLVQRMGSEETVQDARVTVTAEPVGRAGGGGSFDATHDQATNKLYYAANVQLPSEGAWQIGVRVAGSEGEGSVSFQVDAAGASLLDNLPLLVGLSMVPVVAVVWWLSRSRRG